MSDLAGTDCATWSVAQLKQALQESGVQPKQWGVEKHELVAKVGWAGGVQQASQTPGLHES